MLLEKVLEFSQRCGIDLSLEQTLLICLRVLFGDVGCIDFDDENQVKLAFFLADFEREDITELAQQLHAKLAI